MINVVFIFVLFLLSIPISYVDLKKGMIRNKFLTYIMLIFSLFFIYTIETHIAIIPLFLVNMLYAFIIGFGLWIFGFWPAGDAKLFFILSTIITVFVGFSESPMSDLLVNTFVPLFFFYFVVVLIKSKKKQILASMKLSFEPYRIFFVAFIYLGISWFVMIPLGMLGFNNIIAFMVVVFVLIEFFYRFSRASLEYFVVLSAIVRVIIDYQNVYSAAFFFQMFFTILVFLVFRFFFLDLAFKANTVKIKINDLRPGMRLAEGITKEGEKYEKRRILHFTIYDILRIKLRENFVHSVSDTGIGEKDVQKIKSLWKSGKMGFDTINIHISIPFAAFLFFGFFLTILANGSFVALIKNLLT